MAYIGNKPANKAIVASDLDPAVITGQTALTSEPASTDEFLISDAGTLKRLDASLIGGGLVLQVVQTYSTTVFETTSTSFVDVTNLTAAITPSATSSKVLVILNSVIGNDSSSTNRVRLLRGSTNIGFSSGGSSHGFYEHNLNPSGATGHVSLAFHFLDSPSSTSATTYKIQCHSEVGTLVIGGRANAGNPCTSTLTLIEIGA